MEEKMKKKEKWKKEEEKRMDDMKVWKRGNNKWIKNSNWEILLQYFHNKF